MASKGPRSKLDHETRARRQKALEAPREPRRPKTHWDHVLDEMVWLSKDFESERKWKLAQAKKVALRASKGMLDQATRGEKRVKEEEQRLRKVALTISKDVKKFWIKIEKLVLYKHQMELDEKKKKALDKQLEFLLGQTERYSTMLAENLADTYQPTQQYLPKERCSIQYKEVDDPGFKEVPQSGIADVDEDYDMQSEEELEDDEHTIEEDEALITEEERQEELEALHNEIDLPLEELLKRYAMKKVSCDENNIEKLLSVSSGSSQDKDEEEAEPTSVGDDHFGGEGQDLSDTCKIDKNSSLTVIGRRCGESNGSLSISEHHLLEVDTCQAKNVSEISRESDEESKVYDFNDEQEDGDFVLATGEEKDDETTLLEEEELAKEESNDPIDEIALLQKESEIPLEELLARYKKDADEDVEDDSDYASASEDFLDSPAHQDTELNQQPGCVDDDDDEPGGRQPFVQSVTEEHAEGSEKQSDEARESENRIADAAAAARSAQPTGNTFSTTKVRTKFPFLLKHSLREYQHIGLDWLVTMYEKRLNGILADEMGLGKTIMTIALLAHLACEKGIWGPHLIVVPTSVMLNWETEFLKWCPAFKILTYFGSAKERKFKRQGWLKPNSFHNDLMELWSLMHFLMPHIFQSHQEFKDWFCNPISGMVEGQEKVNKEVIDRLHNVLRPFLLRRLKRDRQLCNHPDLFEGRPIVSSFDMGGIDIQLSSSVFQAIATPTSLIKGRADPDNLAEIAKERAASIAWWNSLRCRKKPMYSTTLRDLVTVKHPLADIVLSPVELFKRMIGQEKCTETLRLIQFDCGKLQELAVLLRKLKSEGHRALIFTQMTKMLDVLEAFINLYGYTYMRLDGSTQPEERQTLMQRFNTNPKIFIFILSTRSDRCHRIGQTREVHIYRLISESTIEENILKKANQKRALDDLVIQSGGYNTEFFKKLDPMELFSGHRALPNKNMQKEKNHNIGIEGSVSVADVEAALKYAEDEADYMALKKVEQEEAVENQEFTEDAIGRVEDDELVNEDDMKPDEAVEQSQLRPIDRYAIRFLELWDPIIDKAAMESQATFEEAEWELDRIEKFKEDMEAEIDNDEEPFVYERWDSDFATEAYRQQVEALAQHQLMEELECEAKEKDDADDENNGSTRNDMASDPKPKSKKKPKKAKFKSLKKGSLASDSKAVKEEPLMEPMSIDDEDIFHGMVTFSDMMSSHSSMQKKRKKAEATADGEEDRIMKKRSKKFKKAPEIGPLSFETNLGKMGGKISITVMPVKRILMIKPEKLKKGNIWSRDCVPSPDFWFPQEDAVLCAVVHEYGPHWSLVSETLYGMTAGGFYRGRYRHPVHCCERFRELVQRYVLSAPENPNNEKVSNTGSGKALLKVTEDNIRMLLDVAIDLPDSELLLQKHFTALLTSVWRMTSRVHHRQNHLPYRNGQYSTGRFFSSTVNQISWNSVREPTERTNWNNFGYSSSRLVAAALHDANNKQHDDSAFLSNRREEVSTVPEQLEIRLEIERDFCDSMIPLPSVINLSILGSEPPSAVNNPIEESQILKSSQDMAENRFRAASRACFDGTLDWASSAFPTSDIKPRSAIKSHSLGKHKICTSDSIRPSKSKFKKVAVEPSEMHHLILSPLPKPTVAFNDSNPRFDLGSPVSLDAGISTPSFNEELCWEPESLELFSHHYSPNLISDLDDFSLLPEYIDIG
ncbi:unnamed protein product, partial [Vitis vinifera]